MTEAGGRVSPPPTVRSCEIRSRRRIRRLSDYPRRRNSLNALRLGLAVLVIVSHAWPIGGFGRSPELGGVPLGTIAVAGFFTLSGWLITGSRLTSELPGYAWRRLLRIYPGYVAALLVVAFVVAPLGSAWGAGAWSRSAAVHHVLANITVHVGEFSVGGTPLHVPYAGAWNGSLWTLYYEVACYAAVGLLVTVVSRRWFTPAVVVVWLTTTALSLTQQQLGLHLRYEVATFLDLSPYFFAGAVLYAVRDRVPLHAPGAVAAGGWLLTVGAVQPGPVLAALPLAYLLLWGGAVLPFSMVGRRHDVSYGMYVYAFPVQQLLVLVGAADWGVAPYILLSTVATAPFALLSWLLVERPAQRPRHLVDRFPLVRVGGTVRRRPAVAPVGTAVG